MQRRTLIASGLLLAVLLAPALGLALCNTHSAAEISMTESGGCPHCAKSMQQPGESISATHEVPAAPAAPCCQRKAPMPVLSESSAQVVAPLQIALLHAQAPAALLSVPPARAVEAESAPPAFASPLALLCTLRI